MCGLMAAAGSRCAGKLCHKRTQFKQQVEKRRWRGVKVVCYSLQLCVCGPAQRPMIRFTCSSQCTQRSELPRLHLPNAQAPLFQTLLHTAAPVTNRPNPARQIQTHSQQKHQETNGLNPLMFLLIFRCVYTESTGFEGRRQILGGESDNGQYSLSAALKTPRLAGER